MPAGGRFGSGLERAVLVGVELGGPGRRASYAARWRAAGCGAQTGDESDAGQFATADRSAPELPVARSGGARGAADRSGPGRGRVSGRVSRAGGERGRRGGRRADAAAGAARSGDADWLRQGGRDCRRGGVDRGGPGAVRPRPYADAVAQPGSGAALPGAGPDAADPGHLCAACADARRPVAGGAGAA